MTKTQADQMFEAMHAMGNLMTPKPSPALLTSKAFTAPCGICKGEGFTNTQSRDAIRCPNRCNDDAWEIVQLLQDADEVDSILDDLDYYHPELVEAMRADGIDLIDVIERMNEHLDKEEGIDYDMARVLSALLAELASN